MNGVLDRGWLKHVLGPSCWQASVCCIAQMPLVTTLRKSFCNTLYSDLPLVIQCFITSLLSNDHCDACRGFRVLGYVILEDLVAIDPGRYIEVTALFRFDIKVCPFRFVLRRSFDIPLVVRTAMLNGIMVLSVYHQVLLLNETPPVIISSHPSVPRGVVPFHS